MPMTAVSLFVLEIPQLRVRLVKLVIGLFVLLGRIRDISDLMAVRLKSTLMVLIRLCSQLNISPLWTSFPQLWSRLSLRRCQDKSQSPL